MPLLVFPNDKDSANSTYRTKFAGREFLLKLVYNERADSFYAELYDANGDLVKGSACVSTNRILWSESSYDEQMPGVPLFPLTVSPDTSNASLEELGKDQRVEFMVFEDD